MKARHQREAARRRGLLLIGVIAVAVILVGASIAINSTPSSAKHPTKTSRSKNRGGGRSLPTTFHGPNGVEARWVINQNKLPGTTAWKITGAQTPNAIMGYTNRPQARRGQTVNVYVSTVAPTFRIEAFRMGYYQGLGARLMWTSKTLTGVVQPSCPASAPLYMVQCNWQRSTSFTISKAFVQGDYLLKLVGSGGQQSYIPLTVWDPNSTATYVVMNAVFTWQAFNPFGGYDLYQGATPEPGYPPPNRSRVLSFDRPYGYGNGAANFLTNEYPLIRYMEKHGLNLTYWTNITLAIHGNLLTHHKALLSLGHDEEWSTRMRSNAVAASDHGVNLVFFGASPILRKVRLQASPLGPNLEVVNYRDPQADPLYGVNNARVTQNWWGQPPANLPASSLIGDTYIGYNNNLSFPMVVTDPHSWLYARTGLTSGSTIPGLLKYDFDGYNPQRANPPGVEILSHSPVVIGFDNQKMYADTTYVTNSSSKAGIFESGTNNWIAAMLNCAPGTTSCPSHLVRLMTGNILKLFGNGPTGLTQPSIANWSKFYG
ncbi:N,N-dimethylformamidase beta subunit family domain-containing protein [Ferrimicrobium acidiphilum]|uniref:N,N-dimethylformamidase beta subunit-like C-terminal domain-containing protein n=1 Tax=Ferrimicrobium acidiphilum DSM 19497 TaxID=1121877 RepID=A0A0D8FRJ6_9ACTN|nr:N,N-dimethylformamidase beta subunit family domain-containing protein [Ferrimicrobium acidiphilum]KJE75741.1 hypothetical protein FEAC_25180 [Ferrimicrobium acidiphilum DSM 19497]MCL5052304.1 hypothetical protein [Gammaproteobacteria bacterium]